MPIDADRFLAKIKGESDESSALHTARRPDQSITTSETTDLAPSEEESNGDGVLGAKLEAATAKSLIKADEILDIPLDPERRNYQAELRALVSIINTTLNTQARVGEAALHQQVVDRLPEIIKLIQEHEASQRPIEAKLQPETADELRQDADDELRFREVVRRMPERKQDDG
jgi:hypothetical protein